ncbi:MAG TPA: LysM domain-containing protein [Actinomycetota bacterium]|nr:LysM domain-containing protein [Actinomycetota bacterium]
MPSRIILFVVVLGVVASLLLPRLASAAAGPVDPRIHIVSSGETLWAVATENAGGTDPRDYIAKLRRLNGLSLR